MSETKLPELPLIPVGDCIPYDAIRYVPGFPTEYVREYALAYGKACAEAARLEERERAALIAERFIEGGRDDDLPISIAAAIRKGE